MKSKSYIIPAIIGVAAIAGTVFATGTSAGFGRGSAGMTSGLAEKLGVEESKVSEAMESIRSEHRAERQAEINSSLDKAEAMVS